MMSLPRFNVGIYLTLLAGSTLNLGGSTFNLTSLDVRREILTSEVDLRVEKGNITDGRTLVTKV